jgi:hypothetical protein
MESGFHRPLQLNEIRTTFFENDELFNLVNHKKFRFTWKEKKEKMKSKNMGRFLLFSARKRNIMTNNKKFLQIRCQIH